MTTTMPVSLRPRFYVAPHVLRLLTGLLILLLSFSRTAQADDQVASFDYVGHSVDRAGGLIGKATFHLEIRGNDVTATLDAPPICEDNIRLFGAKLDKLASTLEGPWEDPKTTIRGVFGPNNKSGQGGVVGCGSSEPREGNWALFLSGDNVILQTTGLYYNRYEFRPNGKTVKPSAEPAAGEFVRYVGKTSQGHPITIAIDRAGRRWQIVHWIIEMPERKTGHATCNAVPPYEIDYPKFENLAKTAPTAKEREQYALSLQALLGTLSPGSGNEYTMNPDAPKEYVEQGICAPGTINIQFPKASGKLMVPFSGFFGCPPVWVTFEATTTAKDPGKDDKGKDGKNQTGPKDGKFPPGLTGVVVLKGTNTPVEGARYELHGSAGWYGYGKGWLTDAGGRFHFQDTNLPDDTYEIWIWRPDPRANLQEKDRYKMVERDMWTVHEYKIKLTREQLRKGISAGTLEMDTVKNLWPGNGSGPGRTEKQLTPIAAPAPK